MKRTNRRGFTLIEVIVAMAVTAIAIVGLLGTMLVTLRTREAAREHDVASNGANGQIERIRGTNFTDINGTFGPPNDRFLVNNLPTNAPTQANPNGFQGQVVINQLGPDLVDVQVLVDWPSIAGEQAQVVVNTQIFDNSP